MVQLSGIALLRVLKEYSYVKMEIKVATLESGVPSRRGYLKIEWQCDFCENPPKNTKKG